MVFRAFVLLSLVLALTPSATRAQSVILDEHSYWRRYYRFAVDQVSPAALRAEGAQVLGPQRMQRLQQDTERSLAASGRDKFAVMRDSAFVLREARRTGTEAALQQKAPAGLDWMDYVFVRMFHDPYSAPPPPDDWTSPGFDDDAWVLGRGTFQVDMPNDLPPEATAGNMAKIHIGVLQYLGGSLQTCCYRSRFVLDDPAKAGALTLSLTYRGGVRVLVNGTEVARGHLPQGALPPDTPGEEYPLAAYNNPALRDRTLGPIRLPAETLRKGVNILAVEVRASLLHPVVLTKTPSTSWNALHDRESMWRHGNLAKLELRAEGPGALSGMRRPGGVQVWTESPHRRILSTDFRAPDGPAQAIRLVGARNGTYGAQIVVGSDHVLGGVRPAATALMREGGAEEIPASCLRVSPMLPFPEESFGWKLGDERGLDPWFPDRPTLAGWERMPDARTPCVFDHISSAPAADVPAGTCRPFWVSLRIPPDAVPGTYRGSVAVSVGSGTPAVVPIRVEVVGWRLPDPHGFETFVACEENPYGVARFYNVPLWSDEHFRLIEASLAQMGRAGNTWLNVPVLRRTEFGNNEDTPIRWIRKRDGSLAFDYRILDRYLDLAVKHWGTPRVINFAVMHGNNGGLQPPNPTDVNAFDEATGRQVAIPLSQSALTTEEKRRVWQAFATALYAHMKERGLEKAMCWGYPHDKEEDPELRVILAECTPDVYWVAGPHQVGAYGFKDPSRYKLFGTVREFGVWPSFRLDQGWQSKVLHLAIPRIDSSVQSLHTISHPFAYRVLVEHALAQGRSGIGRIGADEWCGIHYDGMRIPVWIVGMPVLFTLWPGPQGAEPSARFEALIEGIQESEARIFIEKALARGGLPAGLDARARQVLDQHHRETGFFQKKLCILELETYDYGWQARSERLYRMAAEVGKSVGQ